MEKYTKYELYRFFLPNKHYKNIIIKNIPQKKQLASKQKQLAKNNVKPHIIIIVLYIYIHVYISINSSTYPPSVSECPAGNCGNGLILLFI